MLIDWDKALKKLSAQVSPHNFETWFKPLQIVSNDGMTLTLGVPNKFFKEWLVDNYFQVIKDALRDVAGQDVSFDFSLIKEGQPLVGEKINAGSQTPAAVVSRKSHSRRVNSSLNPNYSFERFVVGTSNQFAHAASISVAEKPARNFNPLFIYGGVGLGKTHLLNAIGHRTIAVHPDISVIYISAEEFMNELINAIRFDTTPKFREKYRKIECLLIDDIQFIAGKERTQEEFFHTFNTLHDSGKQIVVTSDKFPKEIPNLEARLRSRFEWGLIADIQPPDMETKIAIINKKAQENNIDIPKNIAFYLAESAASNIREIEGFLTRIAAYSSVTKRQIDMPLVNEVLKKMINDTRQEMISIEDIIKTVGAKMGVRVADIRSVSKNKNFVLARQITMYLARKHTGESFPDIGNKIGGRDHSTVIYACNKVMKAMEKDEKYRLLVTDIEKSINPGL